jgi:hypothetical protein
MPKPLNYWEDLLEKLYRERAAFRKPWPQRTVSKPAIWQKEGGRWVRIFRGRSRWYEHLAEDAWRRAVILRRHMKYVTEKIDRRINYCHARIQSLKAPRTAWDHILLELKRADREERGK